MNSGKEKEATDKANSLLMFDSFPGCLPAVQHRALRMQLYLRAAWGGHAGDTYPSLEHRQLDLESHYSSCWTQGRKEGSKAGEGLSTKRRSLQ